jgi:hypothetical protein
MQHQEKMVRTQEKIIDSRKKMSLTLLSLWIERSTIRETTTKIVNTVATDHVGVKAKDLVSFVSSSIRSNPTQTRKLLSLNLNTAKARLNFKLTTTTSNQIRFPEIKTTKKRNTNLTPSSCSSCNHIYKYDNTNKKKVWNPTELSLSLYFLGWDKTKLWGSVWSNCWWEKSLVVALKHSEWIKYTVLFQQ